MRKRGGRKVGGGQEYLNIALRCVCGPSLLPNTHPLTQPTTHHRTKQDKNKGTMMRLAAARALASSISSSSQRPAAAVAAMARTRQQWATLASDAAGGGNSAESAAREERMRALLTEHFQPTHLLVQDVSGTF